VAGEAQGRQQAFEDVELALHRGRNALPRSKNQG
jgi:hypothetical protein